MTTMRPHAEALVERLRNPARARQYLDVALQEYEHDGDLSAFLLALRRVTEAQGGMSKLARETDLNRANLYAALSQEGHPRIETIGAILHSLGFRLSVQRASKPD